MATGTAPRIYVACLAAYNSGRLHGAWIDATDVDGIWEGVKEMLARSPVWGAEEWAIHAHEGFEPWSPSEYESFDRIAAVAALIEEHGEPAAAWIANNDGVLESPDLDESFREAYAGTYSSEREYAEMFVDDVGLPGVGSLMVNKGRYEDKPGESLVDVLGPYLDWDALERWALEDCWTHDYGGSVAVFRSY